MNAPDRERHAARTAARLALLQEITAALSAAVAPADVAEIVVSRVRGVLGAATAVIRSVVDGALEIVAARGDHPEVARRVPRIPCDADAPSAQAFRQGEALWLESREAVEARFPRLAADAPALLAAGWVVVPLAIRGRRLGTLGLTFDAPRAFDPEERTFVLAVGEQCAQALDRALLFEAERAQRDEAQRAGERLRRLQAVTAALSMARTVEDVASVMVLQAHEALGVGSAAAWVRAPEAPVLRLAAVLGVSRAATRELGTVPLDAELPAAVVTRGGRPVWLETPAAQREVFPGLERLLGAEDRSAALAAVPLRAGGAVLGAVVFGFGEPRRFAPEDRRLLQAVADQCAQAVERARLYDAERAAREEVERARREADAFEHDVLEIAGHDLRDPLSTVLTAARLLQRGPLGPAQHRLSERIVGSAGRMDAIVSTLLDYGRIRAGVPLPVQPRRCDLAALVRTATAEAAAAFPGRTVRVGAGAEPVPASVDPERVAQVVGQLVRDGLARGGASTVEVTLLRERDAVAVAVHHAAPAEGPLVAAPGPGRVGEGGLGLLVARALAAAHGGRIELASTAAGATFTLRLPLGPPEAPAP